MVRLSSLVYALFVVVLPSISNVANAIKCRDDKGNDVDWYYVYKIPKLEDRDHPLNSGYAYVFMTNNEYKNGWQMSKRLITDGDSIFAQTLNQLYNDKKSQYSYVLYNDQPPKGSSADTYGHTKGLLALDEKVGFWLIHSVPKFAPPISEKYEYPPNGRENGQTALCISFNTITEATKIVEQLLHNQPKIYDHDVDKIEKLVPNIDKLINGKWQKSSTSQVLIDSSDGQQFISFAKGGKVLEDLYASFVAPALESDLIAETWRRGAGTPLPSECKMTYQVVNVERVSIKDFSWKYLEDHSKWAITGEPSSKNAPQYTCVGDINRMQSQFKRGGGTVCLNDASVWKAFKDSISASENCPRTTKSGSTLEKSNYVSIDASKASTDDDESNSNNGAFDMFLDTALFLITICMQMIRNVV